MQAFERFEKEFSEFCGMEHVVACSSGTAALHLALEAMRFPQGSEVIVPDFTMVACARAVTLAGLVPRFIDCGDDLNIAVDELFDIQDDGSYKAIMAVHTYGRSIDMEDVKYFAGCNTRIIEDLAEAHGIEPHRSTDAACWSFYKNKVISGEEGGAVAFRDPEHAHLARELRSLGFTDAHDFQHTPRGHNYRMSNCHAELILTSLRNYERNLANRRAIEACYDSLCPTEWRMPPRQVPWVYDLRIKGLKRWLQDSIVKELNRVGIAARHGFKPMTSQEEYMTENFNKNAQVASREVFYLPIVPYETPTRKIEQSFEVIKRVLGL